MVTDLHPSLSHPVAASWVATGQNQSLVLFSIASLEEIGQRLKLLPSVAFFVEVIGQSLSRACSERSLPVVTDEDWTYFWWGMNLYFVLRSMISLNVAY